MPALSEPIKLTPKCELLPDNWMSVLPNSPPTNSTAHLVIDGDNWQRIANDPRYRERIADYRESVPPGLLQGLSEEMANARALIYFNFETTIPEYVNWYLLNVTCCYDATEDRHNRRFRGFDRDQLSPKYGRVSRAGKVYIPNGAAPGPKTPPVAREVKMWAHVAYQDGLFEVLLDLAKVGEQGGKVELLANTLEGILKGQFREWTPEQLRKIAKIRRFARPLLKAMKYLKYTGWAGKALDILVGSRVLSGYLVMSSSVPFDTHFAWEIDMILSGTAVLNEDGGEFSTASDPYTIRTTVFDPSRQWPQRDATAMMAFDSFSITVHNAFLSFPNPPDIAKRAFGGDRYVRPAPGPLDWTLKLNPLLPISGYGIFRSSPWFRSRLENGRFRGFSEIISPLR